MTADLQHRVLDIGTYVGSRIYENAAGKLLSLNPPEGEQTLVMADGCETGDGAGDWELEPGGDEEEEDEAYSQQQHEWNEAKGENAVRGAQQDGGASVCVIRW